jgi:hypothetical protein
MEQRPSSEANGHLASQKSAAFYETQRFITYYIQKNLLVLASVQSQVSASYIMLIKTQAFSPCFAFSYSQKKLKKYQFFILSVISSATLPVVTVLFPKYFNPLRLKLV